MVTPVHCPMPQRLFICHHLALHCPCVAVYTGHAIFHGTLHTHHFFHMIICSLFYPLSNSPFGLICSVHPHSYIYSLLPIQDNLNPSCPPLHLASITYSFPITCCFLFLSLFHIVHPKATVKVCVAAGV